MDSFWHWLTGSFGVYGGLFVLLAPAAMAASAVLAGRAVNLRAIIAYQAALPVAVVKVNRAKWISRLYVVAASVIGLVAAVLLVSLVVVTAWALTHEAPVQYNPQQGLIPVAEVIAGIVWVWYLLTARQRWRSRACIMPPFWWLKERG